MTTVEIRDELLKQQTLNEQSIIAAEKAATEMKEKLSMIPEETMNKLIRRYGIDIKFVMALDYERMKTDSSYREGVLAKFEDAITRLHKMFEEVLHVQH